MGRLEMDGHLPKGLPSVGRTAACPCGSGAMFKRCCGRPVPRDAKRRLLIVGAGATVEECRQSGALPDDPLPLIRNFGQKAFNDSPDLQRVAASYLSDRGIPYDARMVSANDSLFSGPTESSQ